MTMAEGRPAPNGGDAVALEGAVDAGVVEQWIDRLELGRARGGPRDPALAHDDDPVRHAEHFGDFGGDHDDREALGGELGLVGGHAPPGAGLDRADVPFPEMSAQIAGFSEAMTDRPFPAPQRIARRASSTSFPTPSFSYNL